MARGNCVKRIIMPGLNAFKEGYGMKTITLLLIIILSLLSFSAGRAENPRIKNHKEFLSKQKRASDFLRKINALIGPFLSVPSQKQVAKPQFVTEWKHAQNKVGIPAEYYIPVYAKSEAGLHAWTVQGSLAAVDTNAMYVDEKIMDKIDYGSQRKAIFHEAVHQKYLDPLCLKGSIIFFAILSSLGVEMIAKPQFLSKNLFNGIKTLLPCGLTYVLYNYTSRAIEYRADLEAAYLTQCSVCIASAASALKGTPEKFQHDYCCKGYLSAHELSEIAHEHARTGALCAHHASRTRNKRATLNIKP